MDFAGRVVSGRNGFGSRGVIDTKGRDVLGLHDRRERDAQGKRCHDGESRLWHDVSAREHSHSRDVCRKLHPLDTWISEFSIDASWEPVFGEVLKSQRKLVSSFNDMDTYELGGAVQSSVIQETKRKNCMTLAPMSGVEVMQFAIFEDSQKKGQGTSLLRLETQIPITDGHRGILENLRSKGGFNNRTFRVGKVALSRE